MSSHSNHFSYIFGKFTAPIAGSYVYVSLYMTSNVDIHSNQPPSPSSVFIYTLHPSSLPRCGRPLYKLPCGCEASFKVKFNIHSHLFLNWVFFTQFCFSKLYKKQLGLKDTLWKRERSTQLDFPTNISLMPPISTWKGEGFYVELFLICAFLLE